MSAEEQVLVLDPEGDQIKDYVMEGNDCWISLNSADIYIHRRFDGFVINVMCGCGDDVSRSQYAWIGDGNHVEEIG